MPPKENPSHLASSLFTKCRISATYMPPIFDLIIVFWHIRGLVVATTKFHVKSVGKLPASQSGQKDYYDEDLAGFGMRVSPRGTRTWFVFYRYNGVNRRLKIGNYPLMGLATARDTARDALREAAKGADPAHVKSEPKKTETVKELAAQYIEEHAKVRKRSWVHDQRVLDFDVIPTLGRRRVQDVTRAEIRDMLARIVVRAPIRANRTLEIVRKMFNWAIGKEIVNDNPCDHLRPPAVEKKRARFLTEAEFPVFWNAVTELGGAAEVAFKLLMITGQREMEVGRIRREHINYKDATWLIPGDVAKNGMEHLVPLSPYALELVRGLDATRKPEDEWLFQSPSRAAPVVRNFYEKRIIALRKSTGIHDIRIHDLRRTAATNWAKLRVGRFMIKRLLNHTDSDVTGTYDLYEYLDEKRAALVAWAH